MRHLGEEDQDRQGVHEAEHHRPWHEPHEFAHPEVAEPDLVQEFQTGSKLRKNVARDFAQREQVDPFWREGWHAQAPVSIGELSGHLLGDPGDLSLLDRFADAGATALLFEHQDFHDAGDPDAVADSVDEQARHSAVKDAEATLDVLLAQLERYEDLPRDVQGLHDWCQSVVRERSAATG